MDILSSLKSRLDQAKTGFSTLVGNSLKSINTYLDKNDVQRERFESSTIGKINNILQTPMKPARYVAEEIIRKPFFRAGAQIGTTLAGQDVFKPSDFGKFGEKLYGIEDILSVPKVAKEGPVTGWLENRGVSPELAVPFSFIGATGLAVSDFFPISGGKKKIAEEVASIAPDVIKVGTKASKFVETVKKSEILSEEIRKNFVYNYKPLSESSALSRARTAIETSWDEAVEAFNTGKLKAQDWVATGEAIVEKLSRQGMTDQADEVLHTLGTKGTEWGQGIDMFKVLSRMTPTGMVNFMRKEFTKIARQSSGPRVEQINKVVKSTKDTLTTINKEASEVVRREVNKMVSTIAKKAKKVLTPEEQLGKRVVGSLPGTVAEPDPIKDMVNTLFKVYREVNPATASKVRDPMEFVRQALKNKEEFRRVWDASKDQVKALLIKKYGETPQVVENIIENLEPYLQHYLQRPFSVSQGKRVVAKGIEELGVDVGEIVRQHYSTVAGVRGNLVDNIIAKTGLSREQAQEIVSFATKRFDEITSAKKKQILGTMFREQGVKVDKSLLDKVVELSNLGAFDEAAYASKLAEKLGLPFLDTATSKAIVETMNLYQTAKTADEQKEIMRGLLRELGKKLPSTFMEKIEAQFFANVLSGTATHLVNSLGNLSRMVWHTGSHPLKVGIDVLESAVTGKERDVFMKEWGPELVGGLHGLRSGFREALKTAASGVSSTDITRFNIPKSPLGQGKYGKIMSIPGRALKAEDEIFRTANETAELYKQAYHTAIKEGLKGEDLTRRAAELIQNPTAEMLEKAKALAQKLIYQDVGTDITAFTKLRDIGLDLPKGLGKFSPLKFIIPFIRSVSNVAKFGLYETTPLGLVGTAVNWRRLDKIERNRRMASASLGTLELGILASYFGEGKIIGDFPSNAKERDALYAEGIPGPYSVRVGDNWIQFSRLPEPLSSHLSLVATLYDSYNKTGLSPKLEDYSAALWNIFKSYKDKTFLTGLSNFLDVLDDPEKNADKFLSNLAASTLVPFSSLVGATARATDRTVREAEGLVGTIKSRIPGLSTTLPGKSNEFEPEGFAVRKGSPLGEFLPVRIGPQVENEAASDYRSNLQMKRLKTKFNNEIKNLSTKLEKNVISSEEYDKLSEDLLNQYDKDIEELLNKPSLK